MGSQADIFNRAASPQRDIFARTQKVSEGRIFKHLQRKPGPRKLHIKTKPCPKCGETTTSLMRYSCPRKQFGGWWRQWADMEPCE